MTSLQQVRGSGVRLTLPYVLRYSGLWLLVTGLAVVVFAVTLYLSLTDRLTAAGNQRLMLILGVQTLCLLAAVFALAIFTTQRLAGPLIAIRRSLEAVRDGKLDTTLRFRSTDPHLDDIEAAFNDMAAALRSRAGGDGKPPAAG
jgi:nitrogen fixation/metabolism regulation signal transduction histidine kinase